MLPIDLTTEVAGDRGGAVSAGRDGSQGLVGQGGSGCYRNGELQCIELRRSLDGWKRKIGQ